jgi:hypothetical protein
MLEDGILLNIEERLRLDGLSIPARVEVGRQHRRVFRWNDECE